MNPVMNDPEVVERFWGRVDASGDCWVWTAGHHSDGYGRFAPRHGVALLCHRVAYELLVGPIPAGMHIDHLCRNRGCVNPDHLEVVTPRTNMLRGYGPSARAARVVVCPSGHAYADHGVTRGDGKRYCLACSRARYSPSLRRARYLATRSAAA